jgi:hypothetical protein
MSEVPTMPTAVSPKKGGRGLMIGLIGGGVALLIVAALVAVVVFASGMLFSRPGSIPQLVGADTQFYATITPNLSDLPNIQQLQSAYPDLFIDQDASASNQELEEVLGVSFEADIMPWIGPEMAVAVSGVDPTLVSPTAPDSQMMEELAREAELAIILTARDDAQAQAFLNKHRAHREAQGQTFDEANRNGVNIYTQQAAENRPDAAFAVIPGYVVFANNPAMIQAMAERDPEGSDTLASNARFNLVKANLPDTAVGYVFVDGMVMQDWSQTALDEALATMPPAQAQQLQQQMQSVAALQGLGLSMSVLSDGVQFDSIGVMDLSKLDADAMAQVEALREPVDAARLQNISDEAVALMTFKIPATFKEQILTLANPTDDPQMLVGFEQQLGFDLERDLLDWLAGDVSLVLLPGTELAGTLAPVTGYIALTPQDKAVAAAGMEKVGPALELFLGMPLESETIVGTTWSFMPDPASGEPMAGYGFVADDFVIAVGADAMAAVSSGKDAPITNDPTFQAVQSKLADPNGGLFYVNMTNARTAMDLGGMGSADPETDEILTPIKAVSAAGDPGVDEQGIARARLFVYISE